MSVGPGLLVYGSLMQPAELARHFAHEPDAIPVRVRGYRRSFCQEPSWRTGDGDDRGVLTVRRSAGDWFNAILVCGLDAAAVDSLDERERGYERVQLPSLALEPYAGQPAPAAAAEIWLYTGRVDLWNDALRPNVAYRDLCTTAAAGWGDDFLRDFLMTTFVGDTPLEAECTD